MFLQIKIKMDGSIERIWSRSSKPCTIWPMKMIEWTRSLPINVWNSSCNDWTKRKMVKTCVHIRLFSLIVLRLDVVLRNEFIDGCLRDELLRKILAPNTTLPADDSTSTTGWRLKEFFSSRRLGARFDQQSALSPPLLIRFLCSLCYFHWLIKGKTYPISLSLRITPDVRDLLWSTVRGESPTKTQSIFFHPK